MRAEYDVDIGFIRAAVDGADLVALRTALYQATGDETVRRCELQQLDLMGISGLAVREQDQQPLKDRAVRFLTQELDRFEPAAPTETELRQLLDFALGRTLTDVEFELSRVSPGFDEFPRAARWHGPAPRLPEGFSG